MTKLTSNVLAAPLVSAALVACATPTATVPPNAATVTLGDDACSRSALGTLPLGSTTIAVTNESDAVGNFEMLRLDGSFAELVAFVAEEQARIESGQPPMGTPASVTEVGRLLLEPGAAGDLETTLTEGTYAIVCAQLTPSQDAVLSLFAVGPYEASDQ